MILDGANAALAHYLPQFNACFAVPDGASVSVFHPLDETIDLSSVCCLKHERREDLVVDGADVWAGAAADVDRCTPHSPASTYPARRYPTKTT